MHFIELDLNGVHMLWSNLRYWTIEQKLELKRFADMVRVMNAHSRARASPNYTSPLLEREISAGPITSSSLCLFAAWLLWYLSCSAMFRFFLRPDLSHPSTGQVQTGLEKWRLHRACFSVKFMKSACEGEDLFNTTLNQIIVHVVMPSRKENITFWSNLVVQNC